MNIIFLHPDLGIGGAERLVVDAAVALKRRGHVVRVITNHHDRSHCFPETKDGTIGVHVVADWVPRSVRGRCQALMAYIRMILAALYVVFLSGIQYDVIVCDQISASIPFLKLWPGTKVIFYCHFPDLLLTQRKSLVKRIYRAPIDFFEAWTTGLADVILVNSEFTAQTFRNTFPRISRSPAILYPSINVSNYDKLESTPNALQIDPAIGIPERTFMFLSINRYERKKNLTLALRAFEELCKNETLEVRPHLVLAGGYDERVEENVEYYKELLMMIVDMKLESKVLMLKSPDDKTKISLLKRCGCLLYTPDKEHFGIVPLEAMYMQCPVIAVRSGGPLETVVEGVTGYLCDNDPQAFSQKMTLLMTDCDLRNRLGRNGRERVREEFQFEVFAEKLDDVVKSVVEESRGDSNSNEKEKKKA